MRAEASILPLVLQGVGLTQGDATILSDINLAIRPHRRLVVIGPNGAGKSVLLRLCHGLLPPTTGRITWAAPERACQRQAMVFQRPVLLRRSVRANLDHALALAGLGRAARVARSAEALERFGFAALARRPARLLSGGEQQRFAIARAWALRPEVLFLDEPSSHLDAGATRSIEALIRVLSAEGMTIVMTTHDHGQARRLAEEVVFLHKGRLIETGPAEAFFARAGSAEARAFLAGELLW